MTSAPPKIYVVGHRGMVGSAIPRALAAQRQTAGYQGHHIKTDRSKPDAKPGNLMNSTRLNALAWKAKVELMLGFTLGYQDFLHTHAAAK
jgi:nucleoside-diphosphate-sugar epimerase